MGDENAGADNAEERSKCFQHGNDPVTQRPDLTARGHTQSKGFRKDPNFQNGMMISGNTLKGLIGRTGRRSGLAEPAGPGNRTGATHGVTEGIGRRLGKGTRPVMGSSLAPADAAASGNRLRIILEARLNAAAASSSGFGC